jgi:hypothetical protein
MQRAPQLRPQTIQRHLHDVAGGLAIRELEVVLERPWKNCTSCRRLTTTDAGA